MKFIQYLKEEQDVTYDIIKKDCKKYLNAIKGTGLILSRDEMLITSYKKKVRKNRRPKDTPLSIHKFLDDSLKKKFGWNARSEGLFCYASEIDYVIDKAVFPIGNFEFIYSTVVDDITVVLADGFDYPVTGFAHYFDEGDLPNIKKYWNDTLLKTYTNKNFKQALKYGLKSYEIMIKCDYAYIINRSDYDISLKRFILK